MPRERLVGPCSNVHGLESLKLAGRSLRCVVPAVGGLFAVSLRCVSVRIFEDEDLDCCFCCCGARCWYARPDRI